MPQPKDTAPPESTLIFGYTTCDESIHVSTLKPPIPKICCSLFVAFNKTNNVIGLPQYSGVYYFTLVHKKDTDVSIYGLDFFIIYNKFAVIE